MSFTDRPGRLTLTGLQIPSSLQSLVFFYALFTARTQSPQTTQVCGLLLPRSGAPWTGFHHGLALTQHYAAFRSHNLSHSI